MKKRKEIKAKKKTQGVILLKDLAQPALASPNQEFPLRLGSATYFARVESILRAAHFNKVTICRMFDIEDMSDIGSINREKADLSGILGLFIRVFLFLESIPRAEVERLLEPVALRSLRALDLIRIGALRSDTRNAAEMYYSPVWLYPVDGFLIASDRRTNPDGSEFSDMPDIVFPAIYVGTLRFLRVISRSPAADALDLCSGSGIAALVLSKTAGRVVACDITARSNHFAQFNRLLNRSMNVEVARGDLYSAVKGQSFDRIVAHPPYVPSSSEALIYRDSGETGETLIRRIISGLPEYLRPGGTFYSVCEAWDSKEALFEERARSWLGDQKLEFDIIFALQRQMSLEEVAREVAQLKHANKDLKAVNWRERFRSAGLERRVYGAIVIHRRELTKRRDDVSRPFTRRLRLGDLTDGSCLEWALRRRGQKEASGGLRRARSGPCSLVARIGP